MADGKVLFGNDLHLFMNTGTDATPVWTAIACAKKHNIKLSQELRETTSKDSGMWEESTFGRKSWEVSVEALYENKDNNGYKNMFESMTTNKMLTIASAVCTRDAANVASMDDKIDYYTGNVIITSIDLSAGEGENVSYSVSLKGIGELKKIEGKL